MAFASDIMVVIVVNQHVSLFESLLTVANAAVNGPLAAGSAMHALPTFWLLNAVLWLHAPAAFQEILENGTQGEAVYRCHKEMLHMRHLDFSLLTRGATTS